MHGLREVFQPGSDDTSDGPGAMLCSSLDGVIASSRSELIYPRLKRVSISQVAERKVQNLERPPDHNKVPRRASCASSMIAACWPSVSLLLLIVSAALATPSPPTCPAGATAAPNSTWGGVCFSLTTQRALSLRQCVERCVAEGMVPA